VIKTVTNRNDGNTSLKLREVKRNCITPAALRNKGKTNLTDGALKEIIMH
jgi:hypothetical protein